MLVSLIKGAPALLIKKERVLVVGDLHIGLDLKYKHAGILFQNATGRIANSLLSLYRSSGARSIVILGDVKESVAYPRFSEYMELKKFFEAMHGIEIKIAKGNHDGDLERVLNSLSPDTEIKKEILINGIALIHGNAWPSEEAMRKRYLISAHGHFAIDVDGKNERAWLIARAGKRIWERYGRCNRNIKLIVVPPFNDLILGTRMSEETKDHAPLLRGEVFDWKSSKVYDLDKNRYSVKKRRVS